VNQYLKTASGADFSAKDFRTWGGSTSAAEALISAGPPQDANASARAVSGAVQFAASRLGNTPAVCLKSYIDPNLIQAYKTDSGAPFFRAVASARAKIDHGQSKLSLEEQTVMELGSGG
jgi:DNA topoisomerase-1